MRLCCHSVITRDWQVLRTPYRINRNYPAYDEICNRWGRSFHIFYGAVKSLMDFLDSSKKKDFNRVVLVNFHEEIKMIGLVTREDFDGLPDELGSDDKVTVMIPWSYQMGGITIMVSRSRLEPLEMDVNAALKFMLTGGVTTSKQPG
jgi:uncharacterized membrane protein